MNWAARYRCLLINWVVALRTHLACSASAGFRKTTASAPIRPFLVPPTLTTSASNISATSPSPQPRATAALAKRAPSMWMYMPRRRASAARRAACSAVYTVPYSVDCVTESTVGWTACSSPRRAQVAASCSGCSRPSGVGSATSLEPRIRSGAPPSSTLMCATCEHTTASQGRGRQDWRAMRLAPVPLATSSGTLSGPKTSRSASSACRDHGSSP